MDSYLQLAAPESQEHKWVPPLHLSSEEEKREQFHETAEQLKRKYES